MSVTWLTSMAVANLAQKQRARQTEDKAEERLNHLWVEPKLNSPHKRENRAWNVSPGSVPERTCCGRSRTPQTRKRTIKDADYSDCWPLIFSAWLGSLLGGRNFALLYLVLSNIILHIYRVYWKCRCGKCPVGSWPVGNPGYSLDRPVAIGWLTWVRLV